MRRNRWYLFGMLALILVLSMTLFGCGGNSNKGDTSTDSSNQQEQSNVADSYPKGPVTILVPFAPGSTVDVTARTLAEMLQKKLGQPFIVENQEVANGAEALNTMMNKPADGQTMLIHTRTFTFLIAGKQVPYTMDNIIPVVRLMGEPAAFFVKKDSPYKDMADVMKAAQGKPGSISIGGPGVKSINQQVMMQVEKATGGKLNWVPFDGGSKVVTAVLGGHVELGSAAASNARSQVKAGEMRYLGIAADTKLPDIDATTLKEQGIDVSETVWRGIFMKEGTPQEIVDKVANAFEEISQDQEWIDFCKKNGQEILFLGSNEFSDYLTGEIDKTAKFLDEAAAQ